jgi:hypothetical protein
MNPAQCNQVISTIESIQNDRADSVLYFKDEHRECRCLLQESPRHLRPVKVKAEGLQTTQIARA